MELSKFGGHLIDQDGSEIINLNENKIFEDYNEWKKNKITSGLKEIGIVEYEQIYSIAHTESKDILKEYLEISDEEFNRLIALSEQITQESPEYQNVPKDIYQGLGAVRPSEEFLLEATQIKDLKVITHLVDQELQVKAVLARRRILQSIPVIARYSNAFCTKYNAIPIQSQGLRGTCVAFAVTGCNEHIQLLHRGNHIRLSEQYLYFESKIADGNDECGTTISQAINVISQKGQWRLGHWAYDSNCGCNEHGTIPIEDPLYANFRASCLQLNQKDIDVFKATIFSDYMIAFSVPVYWSWYNSDSTKLFGKIDLPIPIDSPMGIHAMTIVGFKNDLSYSGGGYFIIRNSWGPNWGIFSSYGQGYGTISYDYIRRYCLEAYALVQIP